MYDREFTELVKIAVENLKENTVYQMIQGSVDYQKESNARALAEQRYIELNLTKEQRKVCDVFLDYRDSAANMQTSIDKIDKVSQELRETATHTKNIARALSGKEALATPEQKESGFFYQIKRPYQGMKRFCLKKAGQIGQGIEKLERLEQNAGAIKEKWEQAKKQEKKPSIMEKLNSYQKEQAAKAPAVAQNKKKENVR